MLREPLCCVVFLQCRFTIVFCVCVVLHLWCGMWSPSTGGETKSFNFQQISKTFINLCSTFYTPPVARKDAENKHRCGHVWGVCVCVLVCACASVNRPALGCSSLKEDVVGELCSGGMRSSSPMIYVTRVITYTAVTSPTSPLTAWIITRVSATTTTTTKKQPWWQPSTFSSWPVF